MTVKDIKKQKKPVPNDFYCPECGMIHQWEYEEAMKNYQSKKK